MSTPLSVLVIGNGMAGSRFVDDVRLGDPLGERVHLTVLGEEHGPAYNRVLLSSVLAGGTDPAVLDLSPAVPHPAVTHMLGRSAVRLELADRTVVDDTAARHRYDRLVLATGSRAVVPPVAGLTGPAGTLVQGAVTFRTLADCRTIEAAADGSGAVVVLGGGLLGVEAARALSGRDVHVVLVHPGGWLMDRQLDAGAGGQLARTLRRLGVDVRLGARAVHVETGRRGAVTGLRLDTGDLLRCGLLVVSTGVRPEVALARDAGLHVGRGVVVDDTLTTSHPDVHAVGECAEHRGEVAGLVAPAWDQARVLADQLTGARPQARYTGSRLVTRLKADDIDLVSIGQHCPEADGDPATEIVTFDDPSRGTYKRLVVRDDRLVAAIVLGDSRTTGRLVQLYDDDGTVPADRTSLLFGVRSAEKDTVDPGLLPDRSLVCTCNSVSKRQIVLCWQRGARTVGDVAAGTRATTGCGTCRDNVGGLLEWLRRVDPPQDDAQPAQHPVEVPATAPAVPVGSPA